MATNPKYSNLCVNGEADFIGVAADNGFIRIYDGAQPTDADTAVGAQVLLAELRFAADAFPAAVAGLLTANAITSDPSANATGTAAWARILKSDGTSVCRWCQSCSGPPSSSPPRRGLPSWRFGRTRIGCFSGLRW